MILLVRVNFPALPCLSQQERKCKYSTLWWNIFKHFFLCSPEIMHWCTVTKINWFMLFLNLFLCSHLRQNGHHLQNEHLTENWVYDRFYAKLEIYQYGRERWLRSNLTSGLSSCTQVFELAWTCVQHRKSGKELNNDSWSS